MKKLGCILIVDDDDTSNFVTKLILNQYDAAKEILMVLNGREAVNLLEDTTHCVPDLILLDINMPMMNGFEFLEYWEKTGMVGRSKIAMFTTSVRQEDKKLAGKFEDVIAYVEKPLTKEKIENLVEELFKTQDYLIANKNQQ